VENLTVHALAANHRPAPTAQQRPRLLVAGATGVLGSAVVCQLVGMQRARHTRVLAQLSMRPALRDVSAHVVPDAPPGADDFAQWPLLPAEIAVIMFDPPRMFYGRERALWTPSPLQLAGLGDWLRRCGVDTLVVVLPHGAAKCATGTGRQGGRICHHALQALPAGIHVVAPELVWGAAQGDRAHMRHTIVQWLTQPVPEHADAP